MALALLPDPSRPRARLGLPMQPLDRVVDISVQPSAALDALCERRPGTAAPTLETLDALHRALVEARQRCGSWAPDPSVGPLAALGGAAFPLLAAAYAAGSGPLREVPRWAEEVLAEATARDGARSAFGSAATRPVVRALASCLRTDGSPVDLTNLALGLIGSHVLEPDQLARVLAAPAGERARPISIDPATLAAARRTVPTWGAARAERVLRQAAGAPDGPAVLLRTIRYARQLDGHGPRALPSDLAALHDLFRSRIATAPPPRPRPTPRATCTPAGTRTAAPAPAALPAAAPAPPPGPAHRIYAPPPGQPPVTARTALPVSPALADLHGRGFGPVTFVAPRAVADLERWGRLLSNCLGGYGPAAAAGRSTIVGIEVAGALAFAVELAADGALIQFAGQANREPPPDVRRATVRGLLAAGLLGRNHPRNEPWIADLEHSRGDASRGDAGRGDLARGA
jgi:hypothetical protein